MTHFTELIDLASERLGGAVIAANDEFFAPKENLIATAAPLWIDGKFTERGKWMDGWETRRRRSPGYDWCIVRLGLPGVIRGIVVDTSYFKGNYPEHCSVEGCAMSGTPGEQELVAEDVNWVRVLPRTALQGDTRNEFVVNLADRFTHLRFNIYPDGGVARLRVFGEVQPSASRFSLARGEVDLAAIENGGLVVACSDMFFGHRHNLIMPGRSINMGDGWETKRRRGPGNDWSIIRLGARGVIHRVEVDTDHFKGNAPESCSLEGYDAVGASLEELTDSSRSWLELLPRTRLQPHARHQFGELESLDAVTHVRFNIFPDGGIARLRLFGTT
ncbi:MAG TPA: allantoicase, partial [Gemmatimonadaceae bacterium]|nr:allantoicase [Gemmatimonadaceae bacterium]